MVSNATIPRGAAEHDLSEDFHTRQRGSKSDFLVYEIAKVIALKT